MAERVLRQRVRRPGDQEFMSSEEIVGKRVKNPEGYDLGEIADLRISLPAGRVAYVVLRTAGGMFGLGAKFFAVPIEAMVYRPGDDVFLVNISRYRIENESGFPEGEWPREADWSLIEATRPMAPPSQEEARAVTRMEPPPRGVVTTEWVKVREKEEPSPERLTATELQDSLRGLEYPAGKEDLINHAREHNASGDVIATLERFSERTYRSAADVSVEFGRVIR